MTIGHTYAIDASVSPADNAAVVRKMALLSLPDDSERLTIAHTVEADRKKRASQGIII